MAIPYDLPGYHYPLEDFEFQALRRGRLPLWDPTIYCGGPFIANVQAALFYPPNWVLFWMNRHRQVLSYQSLEDLVFLHVWLGFVFCYAWLERKRLHPLAALFGAGIFAFSGYMLLQLQHFGLVCGYAWLPLAFLSIDSAAASRRLRPLAGLAASSALVFLAGYPPFWVVFCALSVAYAAGTPAPLRTSLGALGALAFSTLLVMVQLLPLAEAARLRFPMNAYGAGIRDPGFYLSYFVPNFYNFSLRADPLTNFGKEYLYLGAPAFFGLICLVYIRKFRPLLPYLLVLTTALIFVTNPFNLILDVITRWDLLAQLFRSWYFLAGITAAVAPLAAHGLDAFLRRPASPARHTILFAAVPAAALAVWAVDLLRLWRPSSPGFAFGPRSFLEPVVMLALFAAAMFALRALRGAHRLSLACVLVLTAGVDYKAFGTGLRVNAYHPVEKRWEDGGIPYVDDAAYRAMRANPSCRVVLDRDAPLAGEMRHAGLTTPQGDDPSLTRAYQEWAAARGVFAPPWLIPIPPSREDALKALGVRYFITYEGAPLFASLAHNPRFRLVPPAQEYYKVFEYLGAQPGYGFDAPAASVSLTGWEPERRAFRLQSAAGGQFHLVEQNFPGWRASLDGAPVPVEPWQGVFQAVRIPQGAHTLVFEFHSTYLGWGAAVSLLSLALGLAALGVHAAKKNGGDVVRAAGLICGVD